MFCRKPAVYDLGAQRAAYFKPDPFTQAAELDVKKNPYLRDNE